MNRIADVTGDVAEDRARRVVTSPAIPSATSRVGSRRTWLKLASAAAVVAAGGCRAEQPGAAIPARLPDFGAASRERWINSAPLTALALAGRPVLVEFWTFGCSNCRNTLPWLKAVHARYASRGLVVVGVHTPEFDSERDPAAVLAATQHLGIAYPVLLDPDSRYWNAFANRYWPAFHLYDRDHRHVASRIGELHQGRERADSFEAAIDGVLAR